MKNFIFAMCGFLMMSLVSLNVQASNVESAKCEYATSSADVGLPGIQCFALENTPAGCIVLSAPQPVFMIADSSAAHMTITATQGKRISVPKCPFRYVYNSKYCTHYSRAAYGKLITLY